MKKILVGLALLVAAAAWAGDDLSLPGVHQVISTAPDGQVQSQYLLVPGGARAPKMFAPKPPESQQAPRTLSVRSPAQVLSPLPESWSAVRPVQGGPGVLANQLWVDRLHLYAVAQDMAISGDGQYIQSGWWLNNMRLSNYRTAGTSTPVWVTPFPDAQWMISVGSSFSGNVISAANSSLPAQAWSKDSPLPKWSTNYPAGMPPGLGEAVSKDGSKVVFVGIQGGVGTLYVFNAQTGDTLYTRTFGAPNGLAGIGGGGENCVDLSADGSVVCASGYDTIVVWRSGVRAAAIYNYSQVQAKLSSNGNRLVLGGFSGNLRTFVWSGSSYDLNWTAITSEPWVCAVAISGDGSTVSAITGYNSGQAYAYDWSSSTPLWTYGNFGDYGAMGSGAAISANGGYLIFSNWGDTLSTGTFDVCAVFQRSSGTPVFEITRNDELGSLFACAISDSGFFATAGGKAVHAYQFGNGGEVYAIQVRNAPTHDVASASVDSPPELLQVGQSITPQATYTNPGTSTESFPVAFEVYDSLGTRIYNSTGNVTSLPPGGSQQVTFSPNWTVSSQGWFRVRTFTQLGTDQFRGNDTLSTVSRAWHDVGVQTIVTPFQEQTINTGMAPSAKVVNLGTYTESFAVYCAIRDSLANLVFADTSQVSGLAPYGVQTVAFVRTWTPNLAGTYIVRINTALSGDFRPQNDAVQGPSVCTYEILYDDGLWDAFYWVGRNDNDKFYVRFTPTVTPPFDITRGRFPVNLANTPFDYVMICPDNGGMPDTTNPLQTVNNVQSPTAPGWAVFDLSIHRTDASDLWMVAHWPPGSPGVGIGADFTEPLDLRSYWSSNQDPFTQVTYADWMMRLLQSTAVGVEELTPSGIPLRFDLAQNSPNPWASGTRIAYALPGEAQVALRIYNPTGQLVRTLVNSRESADYKRVAWDGRDESGRRVPSGIYFYRLQAGSFADTRKMVIVR